MDAAARAVAAHIADRYEIERELGRGGMATVYLARDLRHDRRVAVKVMRPEVSASVGIERFLREVRVAAALNHAHILALHDSGRFALTPPQPGADGEPHGEVLYYVMPYVDGESLRDRLRREGALPILDALRIASEVADALAFAHAHGVIHRDVKPENILLAGSNAASPRRWHALVADFGIARLVGDGATALTATGASVGTPAYMSPEQATSERVIDARSDVYSLGCVLYEMLVGEPPFTGPTASAVIARHLTAPTPSIRTVRPSVSPELETVVQQALAKVPADRTPDAETFKAAVDRVRSRVEHESEASSAPSIAPAARAPDARGSGSMHAVRRRWLGAATAAVAVALGAYTYVAMASGRADKAAPSLLRTDPDSLPLDRRRVAVVPLRFVGDSTAAYVADASTDELTSALSRVGGLRVLARSSVQSVVDRGTSAAEAGRMLGAGAVVEGTFRVRADSVEYDVALVDAISGESLWSTHFTRRSRDLAGIQDSVAAAIATRLGSRGDATASSARVHGPAHDAYLRGLYFERRAGQAQAERALQDSAVHYFERALADDPGLAVAHAAIAGIYYRRYFNVDPSPIWEERAFVAIEKALEIDPNLAEAYQQKGNLTWTRDKGFPHEAAAKLHRKAAALKPSLVDPYQSLGSIYMHVGVFDRALAAFDTALALDPTTSFVPPRVARIHLYQGKYEQALREFDALPGRQRALETERALTLNYLGRRAEALATLDSALRSRTIAQAPVRAFHAARAVVLASLGRRSATLEAIDHALRDGTEASHFHHAAYSIAQAYALLGERDSALVYLRRTAADGMPCYPLFRDDPHLRALRDDPRFVQFMSDLRQRFEHLAQRLE